MPEAARPEEGYVSIKDYDIVFTSGGKVSATGVLGINDIFVAIVDLEEKLVFAAPIDKIQYCKAVQSISGSTTKQ